MDEQLDDLAVTLQSFQMMFFSRIIVILSGCEQTDGAVDRLVAIGVMNIVFADTLEAVSEDLLWNRIHETIQSRGSCGAGGRKPLVCAIFVYPAA